MPSAAPVSVIGASVASCSWSVSTSSSSESAESGESGGIGVDCLVPSTLSLLGTTSFDSSRSSPGSGCAGPT